jgi:hypothetical protein
MTGSPKPPSAQASRGRLILARVLVVVGVLLTLVSLLAVYVKREALEPDRFKQTSQELIANPEIQDQVAAQMVASARVDVGAKPRISCRRTPGLTGPRRAVT